MTSVAEVCAVLGQVDTGRIDAAVAELRALRGRLFLCGNGGGAGHASHAACDFRKIGGLEAYAYDNLSELTARINDDGWADSTVGSLRACRLGADGALLVFSVGGADEVVSTACKLTQVCRQRRSTSSSRRSRHRSSKASRPSSGI